VRECRLCQATLEDYGDNLDEGGGVPEHMSAWRTDNGLGFVGLRRIARGIATPAVFWCLVSDIVSHYPEISSKAEITHVAIAQLNAATNLYSRKHFNLLNTP